MKFGTPVRVTRGGLAIAPPGKPGCKRVVRGILVGAKGHQRWVRLTEDDLFDTVGWDKAGMIGCWNVDQVEADVVAEDRGERL